MKSLVLVNFHLPLLTCMALLLFFGLFVSALVWVYGIQPKSFYEYMKELPLQEETAA